uniref:Secreted protein n=1 Tax=Panagrellus redivivus TaxID=6233 RepID=A0A7E4VUM7_PANRE
MRKANPQARTAAMLVGCCWRLAAWGCSNTKRKKAVLLLCAGRAGTNVEACMASVGSPSLNYGEGKRWTKGEKEAPAKTRANATESVSPSFSSGSTAIRLEEVPGGRRGSNNETNDDDDDEGSRIPFPRSCCHVSTSTRTAIKIGKIGGSFEVFA